METAPKFTPAAQAMIEEMSIDPQDDIDALRSGEHTRDSLLAYCFDAEPDPENVDPQRKIAWLEYVDAVCIAAFPTTPGIAL